MTINSFKQAEREFKRVEMELGRQAERDRRLYERISALTGASNPEAVIQPESTSGTIVAGSGMAGGGSLPGTVTLNVVGGTMITANANSVQLSRGSARYQVPSTGADPYSPSWTALSSFAGDGVQFDGGDFDIDLHGTWSGLEIDAAQLRVDLGAEFDWTADHSWDGSLVGIDVSEGMVYVNVPSGLDSPPTYRGALTVYPGAADQKARVTRAFDGQSANIEEWRAYDDSLLIRMTNEGDIESGDYTSGLKGWQISHAADAEFNNIVARGEFRASIFTIGEMHADGGTHYILEASTLYEEVTTS